MEIQDILPLTSILLIVLGFIIILIGFIWMANTMSHKEHTVDFSSSDDMIGEISQMFTYFTEQINHKHKKTNLQEHTSKDAPENKNYAQVLELKRLGKTPDQIARELNMGKGEVNLILGIDQMR